MFLLFLFKSKTRQRKSLGLPLTNYNINPHQCVSELFCIFRCGSISCQSLTADSHTTDYTHSNTCIRQGSGLVINVVYKDKTKPKTETFDTPITIIEWSECLSEWSLLAILMVKPNFLLLFFWGIICTTEAHFTYFVLSGSKNKT